MDRGSYRASQPDRRVINRAESGARQSEPAPAQSTVSEEPKPAYRAPRSHATVEEKRAPQRRWWVAGLIAAVILVGCIAWAVWSSSARTAGTAIDGGKYQAVLLSNGESYFGKLSVLNDDFMKLTDIYYLKAKSATADTETESTEDSFQLIKFGGEVQGPEDELVISKDQILYYENLKPDGKASQAIEQYKKSQ